MTALELPALDGRKALGFLAAAGLTRLLAVHGGVECRLAWDHSTSHAIVHGDCTSIEELVEVLCGVVRLIPEGGVLPGVPAGLPPLGAAPDKLRVTPGDLACLVDGLADVADPEVDAWLASLITELATDAQGRSAISQMAAPSGKQSMRTMLEKPLEAVRAHPQCLREALTGWHRYPGVTGEYLDNQVLYDAADSGSGKSEERGVPGATWLALMSYPLLRTTASGSSARTSGWHMQPKHPAMFVYPLWTPALGHEAITALLEHPLWEEALDGEVPRASVAFGVFAVCRFTRRQIPGRTFAGVLAPAT